MKNTLFFTLLMFVLAGCIERFEPKIEGIESILVVEGIITGGTTQITLSKSVGLDVSSALDFVTEDNALVYVVCDDGTQSEEAYSSGNGTYLIKTDELRKEAKYCMVVNVNDTVYQSEFISPVTTPPVNVSFSCDDEDIHVCITTQSIDNQTGYYLWSFKEDWEIHSYVHGPYVVINIGTDYPAGIYGINPETQRKLDELINAGWDIVEIGFHDRNIFNGYVRVANNIHSPNNKYYCWKTDGSKIIITGTTDNLIDNNIREKRIKSFPRIDDRTSVLYRAQVTQTGIHKEAYDYYSNVLKNMTQTGSIFSPIPSEITGNIKCISNPDIPVIGYVDVSTTRTKDIQYLDNKFWDPSFRRGHCLQCESEITPPLNPIMTLLGNKWVIFNDKPLLYIMEVCVDCTQIGGTKIKPEDWPNDNS